jgi:hypothetical protein
MQKNVVEKYQIAGLDDRLRGFSRLLEMEGLGDRYRAVFRYEATLVETPECDTSRQALDEVARLLRERGYSQLRVRLDFRGDAYLGTQEPWLEYPDPEGAEPAHELVAGQLARRSGWIGKVLNLFARR